MEKVELLINFSVMGIIRNADREECHSLLKKYYGNEEWKKIAKKAVNRGELYAKLYIKSLENYFKYITYKEIKNNQNSTLYYLIYTTNNETGYKIMKDVMQLKDRQTKLI